MKLATVARIKVLEGEQGPREGGSTNRTKITKIPNQARETRKNMILKTDMAGDSTNIAKITNIGKISNQASKTWKESSCHFRTDKGRGPHNYDENNKYIKMSK